jgi:class 3 adenylate cyclase
MGRRTSGSAELLLAILGALERGAMRTSELFEEVPYPACNTAVGLDALSAENLIEPCEHGYRITAAGSEALASRTGTDEVTIMFTDVVGSTELLERLGDDEAHEVRRRHFALLRRAIREHAGSEVKNLGDGLMVAFADCAAATACAHAMQRAVATCADCLELRIGIASGEAVREGRDYFGRPVVVAKRLCDAAAGGEVLVAGAPDAELQPVEPLALKGLREPVAAAALRPRALSA